ncbi:oligosaccharide flippase family protein [Vibrio diabolicus]|uniref:oligosaccharide flippase family protein n=1 Tax=Vibrio diabolicus TaxID=50719 RepID=UPI0015F47752|nr:oligosaccharide flippase family protein [Vibrio diabolicus]
MIIRNYSALTSSLILLFNKALTVILGVLIARTLGVNEFGLYALVVTSSLLLMMAFELGIPTLCLRVVSENKKSELVDNIFCFYLYSLVFCTTFSLLSILIFNAFFESFGVSERSVMVFTLGFCLIPINSGIRVSVSILRAKGNFSSAAFFEGTIRLCLLSIWILFSEGKEVADAREIFYADILVSTIIYLTSVMFVLYKVRINFSSYEFKVPKFKWFKKSIHIIFVGLALIVNHQADLLMVGLFMSNENAGIYRVAIQGASIALISLQVINTIYSRKFSYYKDNVVQLKFFIDQSSKYIFFGSLVMSFSLFIFWEGIIGCFYGVEYSDSSGILYVLLFGQTVVCLLGPVMNILHMTGNEEKITPVIILSSIINIFLNTLLIPIIGVFGAAFSTVASNLLCAILLTYTVKTSLGVYPTFFLRD